MLSEVEPTVADYFERARLSGKPTAAVAVMKDAGVDQDEGERFQWSWRRPGRQPDAIVTIWSEGVHAVDTKQWLMIEHIDVDHKLGGAARASLDKPRAQRRYEVVAEAFRQKKPLTGMLQVNRKTVAQLLDNAVSEVAMRVRDDEPWWVVDFDDSKRLAILVRGPAAWQPTEAELAAAAARWAINRAPGLASTAGPSASLQSAPVLFVNIAWMRRYQGHTDDDQVEGRNFGYLKQQGRTGADAHEQWTFAPTEGWVYGYVPRDPGRVPEIEIRRLAAEPRASSVEGVLVVFMSRDPRENLLKVVGWFENATVNRQEVYRIDRGPFQVSCAIRGPATEAVVLPVADRNIVVPTAQREVGGVGQAPVWYADQHPQLVQQVRDLVLRYRTSRQAHPATGGAGGEKGGWPRNMDPENRLAVEKAAMDIAMDYFDETKDVSKFARGWDIEGTDSFGEIYIEVKGLSGPAVAIELTPNEYEKMLLHKRRYVIFVVTSALTQNPLARVFRYETRDAEAGWCTATGEVLAIEPRTGARARL